MGGTNLNSDLVKLGILPKQVSEYTDADIGSTILIPYTDSSGKILLNNGCIEFEVVGVNHHKDINDESKPTITLMTKNILRKAVFDAVEPTNTNSDRAENGNNRWSVSNIRQWLNSEGTANEWFTPQHDYDEAPLNKFKWFDFGALYASDPGFLAGFSNEVKQHFATVKNKTILCNYDKELLSKDFEETEDKVFLPSYTEMGFGDLDWDDNNPEGIHLDKKFRDDDSRVKTGVNEYYYWMRSPIPRIADCVYDIFDDGFYDSGRAFDNFIGIAPLIVLH